MAPISCAGDVFQAIATCFRQFLSAGFALGLFREDQGIHFAVPRIEKQIAVYATENVRRRISPTETLANLHRRLRRWVCPGGVGLNSLKRPQQR